MIIDGASVSEIGFLFKRNDRAVIVWFLFYSHIYIRLPILSHLFILGAFDRVVELHLQRVGFGSGWLLLVTFPLSITFSVWSTALVPCWGGSKESWLRRLGSYFRVLRGAASFSFSWSPASLWSCVLVIAFPSFSGHWCFEPFCFDDTISQFLICDILFPLFFSFVPSALFFQYTALIILPDCCVLLPAHYSDTGLRRNRVVCRATTTSAFDRQLVICYTDIAMSSRSWNTVFRKLPAKRVWSCLHAIST